MNKKKDKKKYYICPYCHEKKPESEMINSGWCVSCDHLGTEDDVQGYSNKEDKEEIEE